MWLDINVEPNLFLVTISAAKLSHYFRLNLDKFKRFGIFPQLGALAVV